MLPRISSPQGGVASPSEREKVIGLRVPICEPHESLGAAHIPDQWELPLGPTLSPRAVYAAYCLLYRIRASTLVSRLLSDEPKFGWISLTSFDLGAIGYLGRNAVLPLLETLRMARNLRALTLDDCGIDDQAAEWLSALLYRCPLVSLSLRNNRHLGDAGAAGLRWFLSQIPSLVRIDVNGTAVNPQFNTKLRIEAADHGDALGPRAIAAGKALSLPHGDNADLRLPPVSPALHAASVSPARSATSPGSSTHAGRSPTHEVSVPDSHHCDAKLQLVIEEQVPAAQCFPYYLPPHLRGGENGISTASAVDTPLPSQAELSRADAVESMGAFAAHLQRGRVTVLASVVQGLMFPSQEYMSSVTKQINEFVANVDAAAELQNELWIADDRDTADCRAALHASPAPAHVGYITAQLHDRRQARCRGIAERRTALRHGASALQARVSQLSAQWQARRASLLQPLVEGCVSLKFDDNGVLLPGKTLVNVQPASEIPDSESAVGDAEVAQALTKVRAVDVGMPKLLYSHPRHPTDAESVAYRVSILSNELSNLESTARTSCSLIASAIDNFCREAAQLDIRSATDLIELSAGALASHESVEHRVVSRRVDMTRALIQMTSLVQQAHSNFMSAVPSESDYVLQLLLGVYFAGSPSGDGGWIFMLERLASDQIASVSSLARDCWEALCTFEHSEKKRVLSDVQDIKSTALAMSVSNYSAARALDTECAWRIRRNAMQGKESLEKIKCSLSEGSAQSAQFATLYSQMRLVILQKWFNLPVSAIETLDIAFENISECVQSVFFVLQTNLDDLEALLGPQLTGGFSESPLQRYDAIASLAVRSTALRTNSFKAVDASVKSLHQALAVAASTCGLFHPVLVTHQYNSFALLHHLTASRALNTLFSMERACIRRLRSEMAYTAEGKLPVMVLSDRCFRLQASLEEVRRLTLVHVEDAIAEAYRRTQCCQDMLSFGKELRADDASKPLLKLSDGFDSVREAIVKAFGVVGKSTRALVTELVGAPFPTTALPLASAFQLPVQHMLDAISNVIQQREALLNNAEGAAALARLAAWTEVGTQLTAALSSPPELNEKGLPCSNCTGSVLAKPTKKIASLDEIFVCTLCQLPHTAMIDGAYDCSQCGSVFCIYCTNQKEQEDQSSVDPLIKRGSSNVSSPGNSDGVGPSLAGIPVTIKSTDTLNATMTSASSATGASKEVGSVKGSEPAGKTSAKTSAAGSDAGTAASQPQAPASPAPALATEKKAGSDKSATSGANLTARERLALKKAAKEEEARKEKAAEAEAFKNKMESVSEDASKNTADEEAAAKKKAEEEAAAKKKAEEEAAAKKKAEEEAVAKKKAEEEAKKKEERKKAAAAAAKRVKAEASSDEDEEEEEEEEEDEDEDEEDEEEEEEIKESYSEPAVATHKKKS